jgi:hypothetical protein
MAVRDLRDSRGNLEGIEFHPHSTAQCLYSFLFGFLLCKKRLNCLGALHQCRV